ncbi:MAG: energy transducer TonB [Nitrospiraceae bacterium]|nr:energy transducer TonB [Nitrospiraceae bacterium]
MEFRKSIFISLLVHIMLVGSALSFASMIGSISRDSNSIITVSLFSETGDTLNAHSKKMSIEKNIARKKNETISSPEKETAFLNDFSAQVPEGYSEKNKPISEYIQSSKSGTTAHNISAAAVNTEQNTTGEYIKGIYNSILSAIEKAKIYPFIARKKKLEGTVVAEFIINRNGFPERIVIKKSSGHELLDTAAMNIIKKAAPLPRTEQNILVPITFSLTDTNKLP